MFDEIRKITGKTQGPTSIILAGVHGNERCGIKALDKIIPTLEIERGTVLYGYGNPRAIRENRRYIETNLNRLFKSKEQLTKHERESYEYGRAQYLQAYLNQADTLLDIHASSIPESKAFVICERNASRIVPFFPVSTVVSGFDTVEPGATDYYMNTRGKIGICVECGYINDSQAIHVAEKSITSFLTALGHIQRTQEPQMQMYIRMYKKYYARTPHFTLAQSFSNFEVIEQGQCIGIDGEEEIRAEKQSVILFAHNGAEIGDEVFLLGEEKETLV